MTFWQFADLHPWWTLVYLGVACLAIDLATNIHITLKRKDYT